MAQRKLLVSLTTMAERASSRPSAELQPYHMDISRGGGDLPYAANPNNSRKRASSPPGRSPYNKRANLNPTSDSSDVYTFYSHPSSDPPFGHLESSSDQIAPSSDFESMPNPPSSPGVYTEHDTDDDDNDDTIVLHKGPNADHHAKRILYDSHSMNESINLSTAENRIETAMEKSNPHLALDDLRLTELPSSIGDLGHMVCTDPRTNRLYTPELHLYLNQNCLTYLPLQIFDLSTLTVLILRRNKITHIPTCISRLQNLTELSVGDNCLSYLPSEILHLPNLKTLSVLPNPFIACPQGGPEIATPRRLPFFKQRQAVETHIDSSSNRSYHWGTRKLAEICRLALGRLTDSELDDLSPAPRVKELVVDTADKLYTICYICQRQMIDGVGYAYEWWDQNDPVPFKIHFCSFGCYHSWALEL